jgi:hypothetical protein
MKVRKRAEQVEKKKKNIITGSFGIAMKITLNFNGTEKNKTEVACGKEEEKRLALNLKYRRK